MLSMLAQVNDGGGIGGVTSVVGDVGSPAVFGVLVWMLWKKLDELSSTLRTLNERITKYVDDEHRTIERRLERLEGIAGNLDK